MDQIAKQPAPSKRWPKVLLSAVSIALCIVVIEFVLLFVPPDLGLLRKLVEAAEGDRPYVLRPNTTIEFEGLFSKLDDPVVWQVNSQGLRAASDVELQPDKFRIALYGDSETFGWSVSLEHTLAKQMESIDQQVEVINFGVPGYNVTNVSDHMHQTLNQYSPDLVIYVATKNDFDRSLEVSEIIGRSQILMRARFLWQIKVTKSQRLKDRHSPERKAVFRDDVLRMVKLSEQRDTPFMIAFLKWENQLALEGMSGRSSLLALGSEEPSDSRSFKYSEINLEPAITGLRKFDDHLGETAYRNMAVQICTAISRSSNSGCRPPLWSRSAR